jgi:hypothetical protein
MRSFTLLAVAAAAFPVFAGQTDIAYPPPAVAGAHDFNHAPVGQTFRALVPQVRAGLYLEAPATGGTAVLDVMVELYEGAGAAGTPVHALQQTLSAPFSGFVEVDYDAAGVYLTPGKTYTLVLRDLRPQPAPAVTGWTLPTVFDSSRPGEPVVDANGTISGYSPYGAYADGQPMLHGAVIANDAGIGDNAFQVLNAAPCSGVEQTVTAIGRNFMSVNGGNTVEDHIWYAPQSGTTYLDGASGISTGQIVSWEGSLAGDGCHAAFMTIRPPMMPATPALVLDTTALPAAQVAVAYSATLSASGGIAPYRFSATPLPAGLQLAGSEIQGTPTAAGSTNVHVTATDARGAVSETALNLVVQAAAQPNCTRSSGSHRVEGKGRVTGILGTTLLIGLQPVRLSECVVIDWNRNQPRFRLGDRVEFSGYAGAGFMTATRIEVD